MVTVTQSTASRTVTTKSGALLPATIDQQTDFNVITTALAVYYKQSGCLGSFDTAVLVADAMRDSSAVVVLYVGLDGDQDDAFALAEFVSLDPYDGFDETPHYVSWLWARSFNIVRTRKDLQWAIKDLAAASVERKTVTGTKAKAIFKAARAANGEHVLAEIKQWQASKKAVTKGEVE